MLILSLRSDKPEAEIGLFNDRQKLAYLAWPAGRELAETIHSQIQAVLDSQGKQLSDLKAAAIFEGPGSFTGLRIGVAVANALAAGLEIPIIGGRGEDWINQATNKLINGVNQQTVVPHYGSPPHVTAQKK